MKNKLMKFVTYGLIAAALFFAVQRLFYATEMWAYTETAFIFLGAAALLLLERFIEASMDIF